MPVRIAAAVMAVSTIAAACTMIVAPAYPTRTPRPTITPTRGVTPTGVLFFPSAAGNIGVQSPAGTPGLIVSPAPTDPGAELPVRAGAPTLTVSPTTRPAVQAGPPLTITNVLLVKVERDQARANGALASIQVVYSGGRAPYRIYHDDVSQARNPFLVLTDCGGSLVHTVRLSSGDGQVVTKQYYLSPVECPP